MKISIKRLFMTLAESASANGISGQIVVPAESCQVKVVRGVVFISHPSGEVTITEERFHDLIQRGDIFVFEK